MRPAPAPVNELRLQTLWSALAVMLVIVIVYLSLAQLPHSGIDLPSGDKIGHLLAYGGSMWWFAQVWPRHRRYSAIALILLGVLMEVAQGTLTEHRRAEVLDAVANATGVLLGWLLATTPAGRLLFHIDRLLSASRKDPSQP